MNKLLDKQTGLVLEGGGMRGVFTSGVLDYLLDHHIYFNYAVGVSAGACNGLSYISQQRGRAKKSNIDMLQKYEYIGLKYFVTQRSILDREFMYDRLANEVLPFDYDACFQNPATFEMVTTSARTGKACYLTERSDRKRLIQIAKASSSLPFVCPIVDVDGEPMLDGGIVDSIPVERAMATGHAQNVLVLTRNRGYRKSGHDIKIPHFIYKKYPRLRVALSHRMRVYNEQLALVERLEDEGKVVCIRPERPMEVDRMEKDVAKLQRLYEEGLALGERFCLQHEEEKM